MADFGVAIRHTLQFEGVRFSDIGQPIMGKTGYVNDPDDSGGETNFGITRAVAMENGYNGAMSVIPYAKVMEIYKRQYWDKLRCDEIQNQMIAEEMFDTAVNCGPNTAGKFLQRALNVMNKDEKVYGDITVDGGVGPITLRTLGAALAGGYANEIFKLMDGYQTERYSAICEADPKKEKYICGWVRNRVGRTT